MSDNTSPNTYLELPANELKPGMYVKAISYNANQVNMKSEGYITKTSSIEKLIKAGIKTVTVDPSKQKKVLGGRCTCGVGRFWVFGRFRFLFVSGFF